MLDDKALAEKVYEQLGIGTNQDIEALVQAFIEARTNEKKRIVTALRELIAEAWLDAARADAPGSSQECQQRARDLQAVLDAVLFI